MSHRIDPLPFAIVITAGTLFLALLLLLASWTINDWIDRRKGK